MRITIAPATNPIIRAVNGMLETASGDSEMKKKIVYLLKKITFHEFIVISVTQK